MVCDVCGVRSLSIQSTSVLYSTTINDAFLKTLVMQGILERLEKSCFQCKTNTWHICSKHVLQTPKYFIIIVNC